MDKKVSESFIIESYEVDLTKRIKAFYIQNHVQEAAYKGSNFCGAGYDALRALNISWVLNRMHLSFNGLPLWGEEVRIDTWSHEQTGILWHRNFRMYKGSELIMQGTSAWTVLDLGTRSLFRGVPPFNPDTHLAEETIPHCSKLSVPKDVTMEQVGSHTPLYSEIDTNRHVNNCFYTEWAVNSLPFDYLETHELKDLEINYFREVHPGQEVVFMLGRKDNEWYFEGHSEGLLCFLVKLEFQA